jgi:hypothetical protein
MYVKSCRLIESVGDLKATLGAICDLVFAAVDGRAAAGALWPVPSEGTRRAPGGPKRKTCLYVRDREHFGGVPVSNTIEGTGHSASNQVFPQDSRALPCGFGIAGSDFLLAGGVAATCEKALRAGFVTNR